MDRRQELLARRGALSRSKAAMLERRLRGRAGATDAAVIAPRGANEPARLSFAQQRLWFLDKLVPGNPFYNIPATLPLNFDVDERVLQRTFCEIVRRHDSLRTTFHTRGGDPVQIVTQDVAFDLPTIDLTDLPEAERRARGDEIKSEAGRRPFDLEEGPLLRAQLLRYGPREHELVLTMHHIVSDGWSMGVLFREIGLFYEALALGRPMSLQPLRIQYADFAEWQRNWLVGAELERQLRYWKERLGELPTLALPTDRPRPPVPTFRGANHPVRIREEQSARVRAIAAIHGATPFMVLLAVFKVTLYRYTDQEDVVVGAPIANRNQQDIEQLIGFFVNSLVLRTDLSGAPSFEETLKRVRDTTLGGYAHQDLPFEKLVDEIQPDRDLSRNPLTQVTFQLLNTPTATGELPRDEDVLLTDTRGTSIFDCAFSLWETKTAFVGGIEYATDLFDEATIAELANNYARVLEAVLEDPTRPITRLSLLSDDEVAAQIAVHSGKSLAIPPDLALHELFERQVDRTPDAPAVLDEVGDSSYAALDRRANRVARYLQAHGIGRGGVVALHMDRSLEAVESIFGVLKAGAAYLPLDPQMPSGRKAAMIDDAGAVAVIGREALPTALERLPVRTICLDVIRDELDALDPDRPETVCRPMDAAYVLFTSGSTGRPRGAVIPHGAIVNHMVWVQDEFPLGPDDRFLQRSPLHFDASVWEFYAPLTAGARLVLLPPQDAADAAALAESLARFRVTAFQLVPSILRLLLEEPAFRALPDLRRVFCGGEELEPSLCDAFFDHSRAELINLYGPTEATIDTTFWRCTPGATVRKVPIGRPIANAHVMVMDDDLRPVPPGMTGEICIGGAGLALGYAKHTELTEERFVSHPFNVGERLYHSGDRGRVRGDGELLFEGRLDHQVKLRGHRIELGEIESTLAEHPAIRRAAVVLRDESGDARLIAYASCDAKGIDLEAQIHASDAHIRRWRDVYGEVYDVRDEAKRDPTLDTKGWTSSYDGAEIPAEEMRVWLDRTVTRVEALSPRRVLEVGVGTGMILFRVAPNCDDYVGTDFSAKAIARLRENLAAAPFELKHVHAERLAAHEVYGLEDRRFDTVILNSVAQYFPSLDYLTDVLRDAVDKTGDAGHLFVGDVRSLPLLEAFHVSLEIDALGSNASPEELLEAVERRGRAERELVIDPAYFHGLSQVIPRITGAIVLPKEESTPNELTRYRYDVVLTVGNPVEPGAWGPRKDWERDKLDEEAVHGLLSDATQQRLLLTGVPNARVTRELRALSAMRRGDVTDLTELQAVLDGPEEGFHPQAFGAMAASHGWRVQTRWIESSRQGAFDFVLWRDGIGGPPGLLPAGGGTASTVQLASIPLRRSIEERLIPQLFDHLAEHLPAYMKPAQIVLLDELPQKPNGKLDRARLPAPEGARIGRTPFVAPSTALERLMARLWGEVLLVSEVGIRDDFFSDLGGHSLLATRLVSLIRETLPIALPLRALFQYSTIEGLLEWLETQPDAQRAARAAEIHQKLDAMTDEEVRQMQSQLTPRLPGNDQ